MSVFTLFHSYRPASDADDGLGQFDENDLLAIPPPPLPFELAQVCCVVLVLEKRGVLVGSCRAN